MTGEAAQPIIEARGLSRHYAVRRGLLGGSRQLRAVDDVSFVLGPGETLAIVGESGCGKSTLGRVCALVEAPSSGALRIGGIDVGPLEPAARRELYARVQMIFQNPYGSLNPRKTIAQTLEEPLRITSSPSAQARRDRVAAMLDLVGLRADMAGRYPHMLSGGQRQRVAIARALMLKPRAIVADEPLSALDVSVQAQIINLLMDLRDNLGVSFIFISHDIGVVRRLADKVLVMYLGRVVESGAAADVLEAPVHPYTRALLASVPSIAAYRPRQGLPLAGEIPSPLDPPSGCAFRTRCTAAVDRCAREAPITRDIGHGRLVACHVCAT